MDTFEKLRAALSGKKAYLISAVAVLGALVGYSEGASLSDTIRLIFEAIAVTTLRAGISKKND